LGHSVFECFTWSHADWGLAPYKFLALWLALPYAFSLQAYVISHIVLKVMV